MSSCPKRRAAIKIMTLMSVRRRFRNLPFCSQHYIQHQSAACRRRSLSISRAAFQTSNGREIQCEKGISPGNPEVRRKQGRKPILRNGRTKEKRPRWNFFIYPSQFVRIYFRRCHTARDAWGVTQQQLSSCGALGRVWGEASGPELEEARRRKSRSAARSRAPG